MPILIVDDQPEILSVLREHLELAGIQSVTVGSAQEALELHRKNLFPVVLSDIRMPGISGVVLVQEIKRLHPTCIVYLMTGYASVHGLVACLEAGAVDYFTKPFSDMKLIVDSVQQALERHERWRLELGSLSGA